MNVSGRLSRVALLVLTTLSACAANDSGWDDSPGQSGFKPTGAYGAFLAGRFAAQNSDYQTAAEKLSEASREAAESGAGRDVAAQAFIASVLAGRDASRLAAALPANPVAQLVLADDDAKAGRWGNAEARYAGLPPEGVTQILRPLLVAWAQAGANRTAAALATLQPLMDNPRLRGIAALHAGLIADLGGQNADAERFYAQARAEFGGANLRLGLALASWQARRGYAAEARRAVDEMTAGTGELSLARPALEASVDKRLVNNASEGIAEVYLAVGASVQQQTQTETAQVLLQLAVAMRPDLTAARLLISDMLAVAKRYRPALAALEPVGSSDPLIAPVRLHRAALQDALGQTDEAIRTLEGLATAFPARPEPLAQEGDILRTKSRFPEAVAAYDRAIARLGTPSRANWPLFYARGISYERQGDWPKAEGDFLYALRLAPDQPSVLNYLGYAWTERDENLPRAREMIQRAVELQPDEGSYIDSLGWVQLRQGDGPAALKNLERAVELDSEDPVVNGHLGDALAAVGRWREAEFQWRRALTLKPEPGDAKRIEAKLATLPGGVRTEITPDAQPGAQAR